jgi:hypothetical protein
VADELFDVLERKPWRYIILGRKKYMKSSSGCGFVVCDTVDLQMDTNLSKEYAA